jgi:uncharacterized LabA/DUF88 family protein
MLVSDRRYLFIDAGYLRKRYTAAMQKFLGVDGDLTVEELRDTFDAYRAFFYDCLDERRGPDTAGERRLQEVSRLSGYHVRKGKLTGQGPGRQKQVDISLAVDMLEHASRDNFGRAELIAGDSDFVPVVQALVRMGKWVEVIYDADSIASDLLEAADSRYQIGFNSYHRWTKPSANLPEQPALGENLIHHSHIGDFRRIALGMMNGVEVHLGQLLDVYLITTIQPPMRQGTSRNQELLKRYFAAHYGEIVWS